ncbi:uncharacterized protein TrAFT101_000089 [Trichoderma asperellum]|uniref:uncharacterized protein n=1 Tax=Trichoderma asperellum TaxID=101201 RepID=UPI00331B20A2|nr:hypothetical protein TrAFT101_000089 [Trichoderma asperellum]
MAAPFPSPTQQWHSTAYSEIDPKRPELSAKGKNVLITGGGIGIGASVVRSFAEAGASTISILGRTENALIKTKENIETEFKSTKVIVLVADITDELSVTKAFNSFKSSVGLIDVLVHNAAYMSDLVPIHDAEVGEWFKSFEINVKGAFLVTKAFLPLEAENAVLVAMGTGAMSFLMPKSSSYLTSKLAESRFFEHVQAENPHIRVHNVHPGGIQTRMADKTQAAGMTIPMDDISLSGDFAVWLASPEAAFTKGKFLWASWDVAELKSQSDKLLETSYLSMGAVLDGFPFGK